MKICLDTQIISWGIFERCSDGQENNIQYAKKLLEQICGNGDEIIMPTVVVAELLTPLHESQHPMAMNLLDMAVTCAPFDLGCASRFALLWQRKNDEGVVKDLMKNHDAKRQEVKADCLIVATAAQNKVDVIYSNDKKLRKFATGVVDAEDLPQIPVQQSLNF